MMALSLSLPKFQSGLRHQHSLCKYSHMLDLSCSPGTCTSNLRKSLPNQPPHFIASLTPTLHSQSFQCLTILSSFYRFRKMNPCLPFDDATWEKSDAIEESWLDLFEARDKDIYNEIGVFLAEQSSPPKQSLF